MNNRCHAVDCANTTEKDHAFCQGHWVQIPTEMQRDLRSTFRMSSLSTPAPSSFLFAWKRELVRARRHIAKQEGNGAVAWLEKVLKSYEEQETRRRRPEQPLIPDEDR